MKTEYVLNLEEIASRKGSLVLFREPDSDNLNLIWKENGPNRTFQSFEELNGQSGYVIAPFHPDENHPIVLVHSNEIIILDMDKIQAADLATPGTCFISGPVRTGEEEYARHFETFMNVLRDKTFDKLVLSRSVEVDKPVAFNATLAFLRACRKYPHSYIYLIYTPETGGWLGSTPETLLSGKKGLWQTVALAGTLPLLQNRRLPGRWNAKQRKEQEYVAAYLRKQLDSMNLKYLEKGPYPAYAGALSHLKTDFYFLLPHEDELGDLLALLHPTPAVCGLPKEEAYRFILENEGFDRRYYSGFVGCLDPGRETDLYVNLRCMYIGDKKLTLYAGGGLLASSQLDDEFQETVKKLQTMKNIVY